MDLLNNYVKAAEKAIGQLQQEVAAAQDSADRAEASASRAEAGASKWKKLTVGLLALVVVVAGLGAGAVFGIRQQAINTCNVGNDRATGLVRALDEIVTLSQAAKKPTPAAKKLGAQYEAYVASVLPQRDCSRAYSIWP